MDSTDPRHAEGRLPAISPRSPGPEDPGPHWYPVPLAVWLTLLVWTLVGATAVPGQEWVGTLDVFQKGFGTYTLWFGVHPDATDGLDGQFEMEFPPPPPQGAFQVSFTGPGLGNGVRVDLRAAEPVVEHELNLHIQWGLRPGDDTPRSVVLSWSRARIAEGTTTCRLQDPYGGVLGIDVDMRTDSVLVLEDDRITALSLFFQTDSTAAARRYLRFARQPAGTISGEVLDTQPVVEVVDAIGRVDTTFSGELYITPHVGGQASARVEAGRAYFSGVRPWTARDGEPIALVVTDGLKGLLAEEATSDSLWLDVVSTRLEFTQLPERLQAGRFVPAPVVAAVDGMDVIDADFTAPAELKVAAGDRSMTFTSQAQGGTASFAEAGFPAGDASVMEVELEATAAGRYSRSVSVHVEVTDSAAAAAAALPRMSFVSQPLEAVSGDTLSPMIVVAVLDTTGQVLPDYQGQIELVQALIPGSSTDDALWMSGNVATAVDGVARFPDLTLTAVADGQTVALCPRWHGTYAAGQPWVRSDTSDAIRLDVVATHLVFRLVPDRIEGGRLKPAPLVGVIDDAHVVDRDFDGRIRLTVESPTGVLAEMEAAPQDLGVASFSPLVYDPALHGDTATIRLTAVATGLVSAATDWISVPVEQASLPDESEAGAPDPIQVSTDRWMALGPPSGGPITALAVDRNGRTVYAGTPRHGLYWSAAPGAWWHAARSGPEDRAIHGIAPMALSGWALAAADDGVYRTVDGGRSWVRVLAEPASAVAAGWGAEPSVFALTASGGLERSRDLGGTWEVVDAGAADSPMALSPDGTLLATAFQVYRVEPDTLIPLHAAGLPDGVRALLARGDTLYAAGPAGVRVSADRGVTWAAAAEFPDPWVGSQGSVVEETSHAVTALAADGEGRLLAGTRESGVYRETEPGSWQAWNEGLGNAQVSSVAVDTLHPGMLYAVVPGQVFRTRDGGITWSTVLTANSPDYLVTGVFAAPSAPLTLVATGNLPPQISRDGGETWGPLADADDDSMWPGQVACSPVDADLLVADPAGWKGAVAVSRDGGRSWEPSRLSTEDSVRCTGPIRFSADGAAVFVPTNVGLYRAADPDSGWTPVLGGPADPSCILSVGTHPERFQEVVAGSASGRLWRSMDGGDTWSEFAPPVSGGLPVTALAVDCPWEAIYAAVEGAGVFVTDDDERAGERWLSIGDSLPSPQRITLQLDRRNRRLYAGTAAGVFAAGVEWRIYTAVTSETRSEPTQMGIQRIYPNPFNSEVQIRFSTDTAERVTVTLFDLLGRPVIQLVDGQLPPGMHSTHWNGRDSRGRRVASGVYLVDLRAGSRQQTSKLLLLR